MRVTIKEIAPKLAKFEMKNTPTRWYKNNKEYYADLARSYKDICFFTESILSDFKGVTLAYSNGYLSFIYPAGSARIKTEKTELAILFPLIEDIAVKYGNRIIND